MTQPEDFPTLANREFKRLKKLCDDAFAQVSKKQFFEQGNETDNSLAVICKHVAGNLRSRWTDFLTTDGEKPDRHRDSEFVLFETDTYESLLQAWHQNWSILFDTLDNLTPAHLDNTVTIRGEPLTVLQAITRQLTHYAYHTGQIVYLAKHLAGENWNSLSIPKNQSATFNQAPRKYLEPN